MNAVPCITSFPVPGDEREEHAHCTGEWNVTVGGIDWIVDFDCASPVIAIGDVDVTDCLRSDLKGRIINAAIAAHDEEIP